MEKKNLLKLLDKIQEDGKTTPSTDNEDRVLIIDGLNLFLRNFAVLNYINPQGAHIGGLGGFLRSLGSLVKLIKPTTIYITFDGVGSSLNRKNLLPEYKSNRNIGRINANIFDNNNDENEAKANQIGCLIQYLKCLPVKIISLDKVEADDLIAFLSTEISKNKKTKTFIVSADNDFLQLVSDNVTFYAPMEKEFYTPKDVKNKFGIHSYNFLTYKSLMGDNSDKVPGVKGLGKKKLPKMFPELFGEEKVTLEDIFKICESKYDKHVIYSRIIFDFEKLKNNRKIMDLSNPMLDLVEKEYILNFEKEPPNSLDIVQFLKFYKQDGLGNVLKNVDFWIRDNWMTIDKYNKIKNYDIK